jgi:arylsulfatase A-like enzyme
MPEFTDVMRLLYVDIDTLRPDHLGCYGYHRDTSPNIDALAADGTRFDNVYASDVPCLPSRTALITGRFGVHTGVVNHGGRAADLATLAPEGPSGREFMSQLSLTTWAAKFFWAGHRTASFSSFPFRHSAMWWTVGFQEMVNAARNFGGERADQVVPEVLGWFDRHAHEEHWFCHVHLWDPHTPYNTPADYGNPFEGDPIPSWYTDDVRSAHWELPGPHSAQEPWGFAPDEWGLRRRATRGTSPTWTRSRRCSTATTSASVTPTITSESSSTGSPTSVPSTTPP